MAEEQLLKLVDSSISFLNTFYVLSKNLDATVVINSLKKYRLICEVSNIDEIIIDKSLDFKF